MRYSLEALSVVFLKFPVWSFTSEMRSFTLFKNVEIELRID